VLTPPVDRHNGAVLLDHPVSLLDLRGEQTRLSGSLYNELELRETLALVATLLARGAAPSELAVITPYRGQLERLRLGLLAARVPLEYSPELADGEGPTPRSSSGLALGTVHRFQGGERRVVLFSSVVTEARSLTFLNARPNLLNVAVSRAQQHFVCLGHRSVLLQGKLTRVMVEAALPLTLGLFG
jgi:superfamily I DNA and/or RNA helicase